MSWSEAIKGLLTESPGLGKLSKLSKSSDSMTPRLVFQDKL